MNAPTGTWLLPREPIPAYLRKSYRIAKTYLESAEAQDYLKQVHEEGRVVYLPIARAGLLPIKAMELRIAMVRERDVTWARETRGYEAPTPPLTYTFPCRCRRTCPLEERTVKVFLSTPGNRVDAGQYTKDGLSRSTTEGRKS